MDDENQLIALRREKLETLQKSGANPFGRAFEVTGSIAEVREKFAEGTTLRAAGRITGHRDVGKSHFVDVPGWAGRLKVFFRAKHFGMEITDLVKLVDVCY